MYLILIATSSLIIIALVLVMIIIWKKARENAEEITLSFGGFIFLAIIFMFALYIGNGIAWNLEYYCAPSIEQESQLISVSYSPSTASYDITPMIIGKQIGFIFHSSGNPESYITGWQCGKYGRLVTDSEKVFRHSKPSSILYLKIVRKIPYIDDIKDDTV
jgi:hypothetical protein